MNLRGKLYAESPIYRGNARKTLFTRDGDGKQRLISLAGEIEGTAQSLMDAFIGQSRNGQNVGLLNRLWQRLYDRPLPNGLITSVECTLSDSSYPSSRLFDLRMGIKLDEDRWSVEANANYKMETVFRNAVFDFAMQINDNALKQGDNGAKLYYLLQELVDGRFWFGAGKSKGLGRCRLELSVPFKPNTPPKLSAEANHLTITCSFDATNPLLVGWNWGKIDPDVPAFAAVEGRVLVESMRTLPKPISDRLKMTIGGPILSPDDWKKRLASYLPRVIAIWLRERSSGESETWTLPADALAKLGKGKHGLSARIIASVEHLTDTAFASKEEAERALVEALGNKANMANRILNGMVQEKLSGHALSQAVWQEVVDGLGLDPALHDQVAAQIDHEAELTEILSQACRAILPQLYQQVDRQVRLLQSDNWVDAEIANREEHVRIKEMLRDGQITERQWENYNQAPEGVTPAVWREFLASHRRVRYGHMTNPRNLNKSITNDRNFVAFLQGYRTRTRQELAQPINTEFRAGGRSGREVERAYGQPYDTVFMRMLTWKPSASENGAWEAYIPGSTLKGAFRRRASMVLKTLWGEGGRTESTLNYLFGKQGQTGRIFFADAYLVDPENADRAWCSLDGIRIDPKTGQPIESAKTAFLYGYGEDLRFRTRFDIQDMDERNLDAVTLFQHLLQDFQRGDIPLGGEKTIGMGWVQATVDEALWLAANDSRVSAKLFPGQTLQAEGPWQTFAVQGDAAEALLRPTRALGDAAAQSAARPPRARDGFVSHRAFGGYSGMLHVAAEVLRPLHIQESGQPSYNARLGDEAVNGWDMFSMSASEANARAADRAYALPSRSIKGMIRHIYAIASDARRASDHLSNLNPVDALFGWVGSGQNQALMGRLSFGFAQFEKPDLAWFKVPNFYGTWRFANGRWIQSEGRSSDKVVIADAWRLFAHAPLAPIVERMADFTPNDPALQYLRALLPGSRARFTIRFWNLEEEELQRLVWSVALEDGLAHKIGKNRYLGFGSLRLQILPQSYLTDWVGRYAAAPSAGADAATGQQLLDVARWHNPQMVRHHDELVAVLNAQME